MINTFITSYRRRRAEPPLVAGRQVDADVTAAMRALPGRYRVVAYLAGVEGRSYREIADLTCIPLGTVKSGLHRARFRAELSAYAPRS